MSSGTFSVRLPEELVAELDAYARVNQRSRGFVIEEAVTAYIEEHRDHLAAIDEAVKEADQGVFISGEAIEKWLASWGAEAPLVLPEPDVFPTEAK